MAIGSQPEIGATFTVGTRDIYYQWVDERGVHFLMRGDSKLAFVAGRQENIYPPEHYGYETCSIKFEIGGIDEASVVCDDS